MQITLTLTDVQIAQVTREVADAGSLITLLADADDPRRLRNVMAQFSDDRKYSRSTLRALSVLGAFSEDHAERDLKNVAEDVALSPSTTHRYINTWVILGILEQDPNSRRYRRSRPPEDSNA